MDTLQWFLDNDYAVDMQKLEDGKVYVRIMVNTRDYRGKIVDQRYIPSYERKRILGTAALEDDLFTALEQCYEDIMKYNGEKG